MVQVKTFIIRDELSYRGKLERCINHFIAEHKDRIEVVDIKYSTTVCANPPGIQYIVSAMIIYNTDTPIEEEK